MRTILPLALLAFLLSGASSFSQQSTLGGGSSSGGGGGNAGGNAYGQNWVWDDFESSGQVLATAFFARKLAGQPDGSTNNANSTGYTWYYTDVAGGGTNSLAMEGGSLGMNASLGSPPAAGTGGYGYHYYVSNQTSSGFSRIGGTFYFTDNNSGNGFVTALAIMIGPNTMYTGGAVSGDFLHVHLDGAGSINIDRGVTENIFTTNFTASLRPGVRYPLDVQVIGNACHLQIANQFYSFSYSNLSTFCGPVNGKIAVFELLGSPLNQYQFRFENWYAGTATPWAAQAAAPAMVKIPGVGTGNTNFTFQATEPEASINGGIGSGVNVVALMQYDQYSRARYYGTISITNGSGANTGIKFSFATNAWRFTSTGGQLTNGPTILTNNTQLLLNWVCLNSNVWVSPQYFPWP